MALRRYLCFALLFLGQTSYADRLFYSHDIVTNIHGDYIGGAYNKYKLVWGEDGTALDVSLLNPLPVQGSFTFNPTSPITVLQGNPPWSVTSTQTTVSTSTITNVTSSAGSSVTLANANSNRLGIEIFDQSASSCYVSMSASSSSSSFTFILVPFQYYKMSAPIYTGAVSAFCTNNGNILITEY